MAPALIFALALLAADDTAAPAEAANEAPWPAGAPTSDYGLVAWCYGALNGHMKLHDQVMPEVERIERTWEREPGSADEAIAFYGEQRIEGVRAIAQFRRAMEAAEKASVKPIQEEGADAIRKGASVWSAAAQSDKRRLAQEWMSWALPVRCVTTAQDLETRASLFGKALNYNAGETPEPAETAEDAVSAETIGLRGAEPEMAEPEAVEPEAVEPEAEAAEAEAAEPEAVEPAPEATEPKPEAAPPEPQPVMETPAAAEEDFIVDLDDPQPCPGRLEPETRDGEVALVCKMEE